MLRSCLEQELRRVFNLQGFSNKLTLKPALEALTNVDKPLIFLADSNFSTREKSAIFEIKSYYFSSLKNETLVTALTERLLDVIQKLLMSKRSSAAQDVLKLILDVFNTHPQYEDGFFLEKKNLAFFLSSSLVRVCALEADQSAETEGIHQVCWINSTLIFNSVLHDLFKYQAFCQVFEKKKGVFDDVLVLKFLKRVIGPLIASRSICLSKTEPRYSWADGKQSFFSAKKVIEVNNHKPKTQSFLYLRDFKSHLNVMPRNTLLAPPKLITVNLRLTNLQSKKTVKASINVNARGLCWGLSSSSVKATVGAHFSSLMPTVRPNRASGWCFKPQNWDDLLSLCQKPVYVDTELFDKTRLIIEREYKVNWTEILNGAERRKIIINKPLGKKLYMQKKKINNQERLSLIHNLTQLGNLNTFALTYNGPIYMQHFYDFRGRSYCVGSAAPCGFGLFRYYYYYGELDISAFVDQPLLDPLISYDQSELLLKVIKQLLVAYKVELPVTPFLLNTAFMLCISVGKHKKEVFLGTATVADFALRGADFLLSYLTKSQDLETWDIEERVELIKDVLILKSLRQNKVKRRVILKDVTASAIRELLKLLGPKDHEALRIVNLLDPYVWHDTYTALLKLFKASLKTQTTHDDFSEEVWALFQRKTLKKVLMTKYYSVTEYTAKQYFLEALTPLLESKLNANYQALLNQTPHKVTLKLYPTGSKVATSVVKLSSELSLDEYRQATLKQAVALFKIFFKWLETTAETEILARLSSQGLKTDFEQININKFLKTGDHSCLELSLTDNSLIYLAYFKLKSYDHEYKNASGERLSYSVELPSQELDLLKTKRALIPNIIHSMDAYTLRRVFFYLKTNTYSIHDAWLVDFTQMPQFLNASNLAVRDVGLKFNHYGRCSLGVPPTWLFFVTL